MEAKELHEHLSKFIWNFKCYWILNSENERPLSHNTEKSWKPPMFYLFLVNEPPWSSTLLYSTVQWFTFSNPESVFKCLFFSAFSDSHSTIQVARFSALIWDVKFNLQKSIRKKKATEPGACCSALYPLLSDGIPSQKCMPVSLHPQNAVKQSFIWIRLKKESCLLTTMCSSVGVCSGRVNTWWLCVLVIHFLYWQWMFSLKQNKDHTETSLDPNLIHYSVDKFPWML